MKLIFSFIVLVSYVGCVYGQTTSKIWLGEKVSYKLDSKFTLKAELAERFDNQNTAEGLPPKGSIDEWEEFFLEFGSDYTYSKSWVSNLSYRYINSKLKTPKHKIENRFLGAVETKFSVQNISAGLRTRFIMRNFKNDNFKYRVTETFRFSLPLPLKIKDRAME